MCEAAQERCWAEAHIKIARMTLTIKLDRNWSSFQLANRAPPLSVTGSSIAPSARILHIDGDVTVTRLRVAGSALTMARPPSCIQGSTLPDWLTCTSRLLSHGWGSSPRKNLRIHIDVSHSRQPLVKGERLVRYEVNTVMSVCRQFDATARKTCSIQVHGASRYAVFLVSLSLKTADVLSRGCSSSRPSLEDISARDVRSSMEV
jgi:hypothetical protein